MRRAGIAILLALAGAAALGSPPVDNSVESLLAADDDGAKTYEMFRGLFGTDEIIVARIDAPDVGRLIAVTASIAARLAEAPATAHVVDPTEIYEDSVAVVTDEIFRSDTDARARAIAATKGPLGTRLNLLDLETNRATVYAFTRVVPAADREEVERHLRFVKQRASDEGVVVRFAGPPLLNLALDRAGREVATTALPLLVIVCLLVCLLVLRSVRGTAAVFAPVGLTVLASDGVYSLTGLSTNLVVDIAKPLLFVLLLAGGLHIVGAYRAAFTGDARAAATAAIRSKGRAAALAIFTTAIGFGSLALSSIHPIRMFGIVTAFGLVVGLATILVVVPMTLAWWWPRPRPLDEDPIAGLAAHLVALSLRRRAVWIVVAISSLAAGAWALSTLQTEPHAIRYFPADHPLRADYESLESDGLGLATLEVVLTATRAMTSERTLEALDRLARHIESLDGVRSVIGAPLVLREATFRARGHDALPDDAFAGQILDEQPAILEQFVSPDARTIRLAVTISTLDADDLDALARRINGSVRPPNTTLTITGNYRLLLDAQRGLLETLTSSLLTTFLLMQLILIVAVRSMRQGLLAIVPNLVPVAVGFVMMRALGIRLDIGTTMTAAIALGIAVDDTLHFLLATKRDGVRAAAKVTGQAIVSSSVVVSAGFFVLLITTFGPTRNFGLLAGTAMVTALVADLLILPALLGDD